jgi:outer membrane protein assembly factor BamD (BamD/ComL family)
VLRVTLLALLAAVSVSCAYYNTFYLARKYYMRATDGQPYEVDREGSTQRSNYNKSADYSKKVLGVHPKSKWVDDAWLMWARTFIGTDDPLKAVAMLEEFQTRFPNSDLKPDAEFFLGLAYRAARRHETAVDRFHNFLQQAPKHELVPYAHYERSKALMSLRRYAEAAQSAGEILDRYPKHVLADRALRQRAEARYQQRDWKGARSDFQAMGDRALNDDERLRFLLREVDCLESARELNEARVVLRDARSHENAPPPQPNIVRLGVSATGAQQQQVQAPVTLGPGQDRYGKLTLRMGGVELLDGKVAEAVRLFQTVIQDYPRTALAAEAQFRIGFAYETGSEDFARARAEYDRVKEQVGAGPFAQQAQQRTENLVRLERFRTASGADSLQRQAEAKFLIAEHFLFNLDRPDRALEEYRDIADSSADSSVIARALVAQGWVLARKLDKPAAADSLYWRVVREYPGTQAQLAARDYLEAGGKTVDEKLIVAPAVTAPPLFQEELAQAPSHVIRPGQVRPATPGASSPRTSALSDSIRLTIEMRDSLNARARRDTTEAGRAHIDSLRRELSKPDTTGRAAMLAAFAASRTPSPQTASDDPQRDVGGMGGPGGTPPTAAGAAGLAATTPTASSAAGGAGAAGGAAAGSAGAGGAAVVGGTAAAVNATTPGADTSAAKAAGSLSSANAAIFHGPVQDGGSGYGPALDPAAAAADSITRAAMSAPGDTSAAARAAAAGAAAGAATATKSAAGAAGAGATPPGAAGMSAPSSASSSAAKSTPTSTSTPQAAPTATKPTAPAKDPNRPFTEPRRRSRAERDSIKRVQAYEDSVERAKKQAKKDAKAAKKAAADSAKGKN